MRSNMRRGFLALLACAAVATPALASDADVNAITRIERVASEIEIEVTSSRPFPGRAMPPVLRIGTREFRRSRSGVDGSLNTLIFILSADEFAQTESGDSVSVVYGRDPSPVERWDFGALDKSAWNPEEEPS